MSKKGEMKTPKAPKATTPALDAATAAMTGGDAPMEVPGGEKKEALKKKEPATYSKYRVALEAAERAMFNFGNIKSMVHDTAFAKKFLSHHLRENFGVELSEELWAKLQAKVKFNPEDPALVDKNTGFLFKNKGMEGTPYYSDVMRVLKQELGEAADKLTYDANSITRVLLRIALGKKTIVNDIQTTTMRSDKYLCANDVADEFEDRGGRISAAGEVMNKVSNFRVLKGKFYISDAKTAE